LSDVSHPDSDLSPLKRALLAVQDLTAKLEAARRAPHEPVAIVGLSCRFPGGANDPESYWTLLRDGREGVGEVPRDRWDVDAYYDPDPDASGKMYTRSGGFLDAGIDLFDARFFDISPREAIGMDPQQRLLLELAWEALENAGAAPERLSGSRTGVFVGISSRDYGIRHSHDHVSARIDAYSATGNAFSVAAGRISYVLGLQGPNLALDTACSSSLVAVALAVQSLRDRHSDIAMAGGVNLMLTPETTIGMCRLRALSPDARCRTFDAAADGYVRGEGGGIVVLKRLSDAVAAGDRIHAVIRGVAVNHDGRSSGLTVPSTGAQQAVLRAALADAGMEPGQVNYLEAHGTGTALGDPIEVRAAASVFGKGRAPDAPLAIGSVKTNFGHLEAAAGMAGLIKLVLSVSRGEIPPHLHLTAPTPHVDWAAIPVVIPTELTPWPHRGRPRAAGVSSFGFSGTNAHVLIEEAPPAASGPAPAAADRPVHVLPLSAKSEEALRELASRYAAHLDGTTDPVADICFTAGTGRNHFEHRLAAVGETPAAIAASLRAFSGAEPRGDLVRGRALPGGRQKVAFLFTGHGAQYVQMGRRLYETQPVFRAAVDECDALLRSHLERSLLSVLYPENQDEAEQLLLDGMTYSQPALFAIEYALVQLWASWGVRPTHVLGHSVGEYVAATVAGIFSVADGLKLVAARGRLMDSLTGRGGMVAVFAPEAEVLARIAPFARDLSLAVINAPSECVVSGSRASLEALVAELESRGTQFRWLNVAQAAHSPLLDPILDEFEAVATTVEYNAPKIPLISCTTAREVTGAEAGDAAYWRRHLRQPVRFAAAVRSLRGAGCGIFVEAGPHPVLLGSAQQCEPEDGIHWVPSLRRGYEEWPQMLHSLAALYVAGVRIDWAGFDREYSRRRVALPTYAFCRERYWPAEHSGSRAGSGRTIPVALDGAAEWIYRPEWQPLPQAGAVEFAAEPGHWLLLADRGGWAASLAERLRGEGHNCTLVGWRAAPGDDAGGAAPCIDPTDADALRARITEASAAGRAWRGVIHLWSLDAALGDDGSVDALRRAQTLGSHAVLHLVQALCTAEVSAGAAPPRLWVVTRGAQALESQILSLSGLAQAPVWGLGKSIALEHPQLWGGLVDLDESSDDRAADAAAVLAALRRGGESEVAIRGDTCFAARVVAEEAELPAFAFEPRIDAAYLITGGLGGLGLQVARWLAGRGARRLILLGRTALPPRSSWMQAVEGPEVERIRAIREIEALGAAVHVAAVDVADAAQFSAFLSAYDAEGWPAIRGVVHAAGLLHDASLLRLDAAAMKAAARPKLDGGWMLHSLLRERPLDFFVVFSSAASLIGSAGQGNYAAANAFLDSLAAYRRGQGLPALSINWGPWADVGLAARADLAARRARGGMGSIAPGVGVELFGRLLRGNARQVGVVPLGAAALRDLFPAETPLLKALPRAASPEAGVPAAAPSVAELLRGAPESQRVPRMLAHLQQRVGRITMADVATIEPEHGVLQLGMDSLMIVELVRELNRDLQITLYPREIFERPSLIGLAEYLVDAIGEAPAATEARGDAVRAAAARPARPVLQAPEQRNPPAVFLLCSPRSGSTLLRVMLAGHPALFSPPELHLLPFVGMAEWKTTLEHSYFGEGLQRALMELKGIDAGQSQQLLEDWVARDLPIPEVYRRLQELARPRLLVDKSAAYAAELSILERAEQVFEGALYIHLVRHPYSAIESFVRNRMDRLFDAASADSLAVAEQVWSDANSNALEFLGRVDAARQCRVRYEELVTTPEPVMRTLCRFLAIEFTPDLLTPYEGGRMTDGVHEKSMLIGDPSFHTHSAIDASLADAWRHISLPRRLGGYARRVATELGYELEPAVAARPPMLPQTPVPPAHGAAVAASALSAVSGVQRRPATEELPAIRLAGREGPLPLSFSQQRLFFLDQLDPGAATYNMPLAVRLSGTLNVAALERSLRAVLQRHETLRTNLVLHDGAPHQEIGEPDRFDLPVDDLATVPDAEREARVRQLTSEEVRRPFDLRRDAKLRARLLRLGEAEHVLVLAVHHVASDGTSLGILVREMAALYEAFAAGKPSPLAPLPIQYADYALWQHRYLQGPVLDAQLGYWKQQLAELPVLELPTDRPRPARPTHHGAGESLLLSARLSEMLLQLSREENVTLFMTLLAAFQLLLSRLSGQDDVVVGTPIAGRHRAGTEGLIGVFLNNLALRTDLSGDPSFRELLERVRRTTLDAYANQDIPFEKLIEELKPERDLSRTPLFQVLFNMLPARTDQGLRFGAAAAEVVVDIDRDAKFDFTLYAAEGPGLRLQLVYNTDLFDAWRMRELLRQYERLLAEIVAAPEQAVSRYGLRTATAEATLPDPRQPLPVRWAGSLTARLSALAQRAPEQRALQDERESWSYAELEEVSTRLANRLRAQGLGRGEVVALYAARDASLAVALLGVLKAGGAFLILDPAYPAARLRSCLALAAPRAWLQLASSGEPPAELRDAAEALPIRLTLPREKASVFALLAGDSREAPAVEIGPEDLSYVAFTSGTTGEPKGILGTHRPLSHFFEWYASHFGFTTEERFSAISGLAHDPLLRDLFAPLWLGATVCIPSAATREEPRALLEWLQRERITAVHLTPAMGEVIALAAEGLGAEGLLEEDAPLPHLRYAVFGGDVLMLRQVAQLRRLAPAVQCVNVYGATETPQVMAVQEITPEEVRDRAAAAAWATAGQAVPLGQGIEGVQLLVLGEAGRLCGIGEVGEICVRTPYLSRGYLADEALTAERFVSNPFTGDVEDRLYRTGDRGRYLPDGSVAFAGRADQQLQVRGYRVEPAEVEAALVEHAAVRQAVVLGREDGSGQRQLLAYVVAAEGRAVHPSAELREHLRGKLPEYMVPAGYVPIEVVPLTKSGKVDRRALLALEVEPLTGASEHVAPRTPVEELLAGIWQELLKVERVGVHTSFFELGGHSLLAMQLVSRIRDTLRIELPLRTLFEAPTIAGLGEHIEALRPSGASLEAPPLVRVSREGPLPLSFAQQRLWFLQQLEPESTAYNIHGAVRLSGALEVAALEQSFAEVVRRHETLRTVFREVGGEPRQVVRPAGSFALETVDLSALPEAERTDEVERRTRQAGQTVFDLAEGPLLRACLLRLGEQKHVLLVVMHHIITDGWSLRLMTQELRALYGSFAGGEPSPLPELAVQYGDYAAWQRQYLSGEVLDRQLGYWKRQLTELPMLELPTDRPRPTLQAHRGAMLPCTLSRELTVALRRLSHREEATLFMSLLGTFELLLSRLSGQEDFAVGSPIAGRTRREIEPLIGYFLNNLVLRADLSGDPSFRELLGRVREATLGAFAHQEIPFEKLVEELRPPRDLSRTPFFQVLFNLVPPRGGEQVELDGVVGEVLGSGEAEAKFDLTLYVAEGEQIQLRLVYNADLFDAASAERMLEAYRVLLEAVAREPERRISTLPLLRSEERLRLAAGADALRPTVPFEEFPAEALEHSIAVRFAEVVRNTPAAVAVETARHRWSYAELARRAKQVACALRRHCGTGEARVALLLEHDAPMLAALLGSLQAGTTYVPLDPSFPEERLRRLLDDAEASLILTEATQAAPARDWAGETPVLVLEEILATEPEHTVEVEVSPETPAYILYTSGSTGEPKGVVQSHRNVLHHIRTYVNRLHLGAGDRLSLFSAYGFDAAVMDIYGALLSGATLCPIDLRSEAAGDLPRQLLARGVTVYHSTPTVYRHLLSQLNAEEDLSRVRLVVLGGEEVVARDVELFRRHFAPGTLLVNGLGPTECTLALQQFIDHDTVLPRGVVPVGQAVEGVEVLLLNEAGEPVEVYATGELVLRSPHVALGYWKRPEQSAAAFQPDPEKGERRLYRTGDLGRLLPGGSIQYIGRKDAQLKLRGYRIEPAEIEAVLLRHAALRRAVVLARELGGEPGGERQLVAYVVAREGVEIPKPGELREHLRGQLPEYMVPAAYVAVAEIPLTANGKVDRRALLALEVGPLTGAAEHVAPRTPVEELLAGIWQELLKVERVGVHTSFFELGGHSLLAMQLVSRIRTTLRIELPLRTLFEAPTIAGLGEHIEALRRSGASLEAPPLVRVSREGPLPLSFAQQRLWFLQQLEPRSTAYNILGGVRLRGVLDAQALERSFAEVVRRHESLRTTFAMVDGAPVQVIAPATGFPLEVVDLAPLEAEVRAAEVERWRRTASGWVFDLEQGPLLCVWLLRLGAQEHVLLMTMHHVITDGWSLGVLTREVGEVYAAESRGTAARLPELPVQYADYAAWQREFVSGERLEAQLAYWKEHLADLPTLELPTDRPRPRVQTHNSASLPLVLPDSLTAELKRLSQRENATLFMTLLSAFNVLLARHSGQEDIAVGTPIAGRSRAQIEGLIGIFLNNLVLRTNVGGDPSFRELLARVREVTLGAYAHQDIPFEKLIEELKPPRDASRTPLFQVLFNLVPDRRGNGVEWEGIEAEVEAGDVDAGAKFDLTLYVSDNDQLRLRLVFNTDLFEEARMVELLRQFEGVLRQAVADPDLPVSMLELAADAITDPRPDPTAPLESVWPGSLCARLSARAATAGQRVAVLDADESWSYRDLDEVSRDLANRLCRGGLARGQVVAVYAHRSASLPVALLGVLRAGGAFLILDPAYPEARLLQILDQAAPRGWLQMEAAGPLPEALRQRVQGIALHLSLPSPKAALQRMLREDSAEAPAVEIGPDDLAYVAFTSGTTGVPKGILGTHRPVSHFLQWHAETFGLAEQDRFSVLSGLAHDPLLRDLFAPLWVGGTVCFPEAEALDGARSLMDWMGEQQISVAHLTPAMCQLLELGVAAEATLLPALRYAFFGGDRLPYARIGALRRLAPGVECVNFYGATETPQAMGYRAVSQAELERGSGGAVPVGQGIEGVQLLVMNGHGRLCGVGEVGEIHVRTPYLASGYLGDAALTEERFVANPYTGEAADRLYRTGDRGRYLPDGSVAFAGRADGQVKIRGFRVEPAEIEAVLMEHTAVRKAVVLARRSGAGDDEQRLSAYLVVEAGPLAVAELREQVRAALPSYMVPAEYVFVEHVPLTRNGKVDRRALLALEVEAQGAGAEYVAPGTPMEQLIAGIWRELLQVQRIGVHDNFYDLGGHSLLAARFAARLRDGAGVRINLAELAYQTLGQLAATHDQVVTVRSPSVLGRLASRLGMRRVRSKASIEGD
jgi:amino acid adenylation domain-containing protein